MELKALTKQVRLSRWTEVINDKIRSGKNVRKYCEENGINEKTYYYWQRKLRESACDIYDSLSNAKPSTQEPAMFSEVVVTSPQAKGHTQSEASGLLQVEIGTMKITADSQYPVETLSELLKALLRP